MIENLESLCRVFTYIHTTYIWYLHVYYLKPVACCPLHTRTNWPPTKVSYYITKYVSKLKLASTISVSLLFSKKIVYGSPSSSPPTCNNACESLTSLQNSSRLQLHKSPNWLLSKRGNRFLDRPFYLFFFLIIVIIFLVFSPNKVLKIEKPYQLCLDCRLYLKGGTLYVYISRVYRDTLLQKRVYRDTLLQLCATALF